MSMGFHETEIKLWLEKNEGLNPTNSSDQGDISRYLIDLLRNSSKDEVANIGHLLCNKNSNFVSHLLVRDSVLGHHHKVAALKAISKRRIINEIPYFLKGYKVKLDYKSIHALAPIQRLKVITMFLHGESRYVKFDIPKEEFSRLLFPIAFSRVQEVKDLEAKFNKFNLEDKKPALRQLIVNAIVDGIFKNNQVRETLTQFVSSQYEHSSIDTLVSTMKNLNIDMEESDD
jgi:hypothetical protein